MINHLKNNMRPIKIQLLICLVLTMLSFVGWVFDEWVIIVNMAVCSILSLGNVILFVVSKSMINENGPQLSFAVFTLLRYLLMIIGLIVSAVLIYVTMPAEVVNLRYLYILGTSLPFVVTVFSLMMENK